MNRINQIIQNLKYLSRAIGTQELYANLNVKLKLVKSRQTPGDNVLFLVAHPGEDVFACGGIIKKYTKAGKKVSIVYFCDGSMGNKSTIRDSSLIFKRKKETKEAIRVLGIKEGNLVFWGFKDHKLQSHATNIKALTNLLIDIKPNIVFLPSLFETTSDLKAINNIFNDVLNIQSANLEYFSIWFYELFTPLQPNQLIDISEEISFKKQAIQAHATQLQIKNYGEAMLGLNSYRAQINGINGFAEAFFSCNANLYLKLYSLIHKK